MALPPTAGKVDVQSLLNVPAPVAPGTLLSSMPTSSTPGSVINYLPAFQPSTPYSATNLPEFMKGYEQTPSGRFVMSQGLLGVAPTIDKVQSLFSQGYAQEYAPLEQRFQESFAIDPSWFGNMYRSGAFIPKLMQQAPMQQDTTAQDIATAVAATAAYPVIEDALKTAVSPVEPAAKTTEEGAGYVVEEVVTDPIKKNVIDPMVDAYKTSALKKDIVDPMVNWVDETFDKPAFINDLQEKAKGYLKDIGDSQVVNLAGDAFKSYATIENFVEKPTAEGAWKTIDAVDKLSTYLPEDMQQSIQETVGEYGGVIGAGIDAASLASIVSAFDDPTVENISQAYGGLDHLAQQGYFGTDISTGLPGAENIAGIGSIVGGLKALEGGIDSPGEALQVATGAASAASLLGAGTTVGAAGTAALGILGPIGAVATLASLADKEGATIGNAVLGRDEFGNYSIASESSKNKGSQKTIPEAHAANLVLRELETNYGYEFNEDAWKDVDTKIDYDMGVFKRSANDIVAEAIQKGALTPTESTPKSINFSSILNDARKYTAPYTSTDWQAPYGLTGFKVAEQAAAEGADIVGAGMAGALADVGLGYTPMSDIMSGYDFSGINLDLSGIKI